LGATAVLASAAFVHQRAWLAERAYPPIGQVLEVDGVRLHCIERGEGTPLVMLHGNGSMIQELRLSGLYELAATRYRVIVPDRPGYGWSSRPRRRWWGPHAQAALLRSMLAQLGIERPIILGHSFGALVAIFGWQVAELNSQSFSPALGLNLRWLYLSSVVGGMLIVIYSAASIADGWRDRWPGVQAPGSEH